MATIGTSTKTDAGFSGTIQTMGLKAKVAITPAEKRGDSQPDYRLFVGKVEIGAGWVRTNKGNGREFVSVKLHDPESSPPNLRHRDRSRRHTSLSGRADHEATPRVPFGWRALLTSVLFPGAAQSYSYSAAGTDTLACLVTQPSHLRSTAYVRDQ